MKISRRKFVVGLSTLPMASALSEFALPQKNATPGSRTLSIYMHGLFFYSVQQGHILAVTPANAQHQFLIGADAHSAHPIKGSHEVTNVDAGAGKFDPALNYVVKANATPSGWYFSIDLHAPNQIYSMKHVEFDFADGTKGCIPKVQCFIYNVPNGQAPGVSGSDGWQGNAADLHQKIHIYAEPGACVTLQHAIAAFHDLVTPLGLNLAVKGGKRKCKTPPAERQPLGTTQSDLADLKTLLNPKEECVLGFEVVDCGSLVGMG